MGKPVKDTAMQEAFNILEEEQKSVEIAAITMVGDLMACIIEQIKVLKDPWEKLSEAKQDNYISRVEAQCVSAVEQCIDIIASEDRKTVNATLEKVAFGKGVAISMSALAEEDFIWDLTQAQGKSVKIVILDKEEYTEGRDTAPKADKDQKTLELEGGNESKEAEDMLYPEALAFVQEAKRVSISAVQRKLRIGYNRAAKLVDKMEKDGWITPMESNGSRKVNDVQNC